MGGHPIHVHLPALQYFAGNAECITLLSQAGAAIRAAFLFWDAVDASPQDAIRALERTSGATLNVISCRRRGWNLDLFELVSVWLPDVYVLSMTNLLVVDSKPTEVCFLFSLLYLLRAYVEIDVLECNEVLPPSVYQSPQAPLALRRYMEDGRY